MSGPQGDMNIWMLASAGMLVAMVPCMVTCFRGTVADRLAGLLAAGMLAALVLLMMVEGYGRPSLFDVPLTAAMLTLGSGLVFSRLVQRWL